MTAREQNKSAIWAITPNGVKLADRLAGSLPDADIYVSHNLAQSESRHYRFERLAAALENKFRKYAGHVFIMSTGIVVRILAPLLEGKTQDPAVAVVDELGKNVISLLSGHIGGANELTHKIARIINANPVITTATDINEVPAIDVLAAEKGLVIENPAAIKTVNMALLKGEEIRLHDPYGFLQNRLLNPAPATGTDLMHNIDKNLQQSDIKEIPCIYIDDIIAESTPAALTLRPPSLVAGIGCNRDTGAAEIHAHLKDVLASHRLAPASLKCLASIDAKKDEAGLIAAADGLGLPLLFFRPAELKQVRGIKNPSALVEKHVGVKSVCEAAAILAAQGGTLIVPKQLTPNVTVAIARINFSSSE